MIAVDTSALLAIVFGEAKADACIKVLTNEPDVLVSAGTAAEALIVAGRRNVGEEMTRLLEGLGLEIVTVTLRQRGASRKPMRNGAKAYTRQV
jgi:ribonuclease VapC